jgi:predicted DNA-binding protein with PD1-like motif
MRDMRDSNIRTIAVRFSAEEHRLLADLATDQGISVEALIREALTLGPFEARAPASHLHVVTSDERGSARGWNRDGIIPSS